ncbi:hypothetical protein SOPP22_13735 [Shewanella sp. OPT22]|nr:hypothetical protein SOPP22_13735 [Shewanella sp. OPT22]
MHLNYRTPHWEYVDGNKKRGRPLLLLSPDELPIITSYLLKKIRRNNVVLKFENYNSNFTDKVANSYISETSLLLKKLQSLPVKDTEFESLDVINVNLNRIFSEKGWRAVRFELRQIKKRNKLVRLELAKPIYEQLEQIKQIEKLESLSSAIEFLVDTYHDHKGCLGLYDEN